MHPDHLTATQVSMEILKIAVDEVKIGTTGVEIDNLVGEECEKRGVIPAFLGVGSRRNPFPANLCISVNDTVLHAIPNEEPFLDGDLVKIDFGIIYKGFYTDHCVTVGLGDVSQSDKKLMNVSKLAVEAAVSKSIPGNRTGDLGFAMQSTAELAGFNVLKNYVGHGIGDSLHLRPEIPAYGRKGDGDLLKPGMVLCVEAQVVAGSDDTYVASDGWSVVTKDGSKGVMFEYMVEILDSGNRILTDTRNWPIFR